MVISGVLKRLCFILLIILCVVFVSGCSDSSGNSDSSSDDSTADDVSDTGMDDDTSEFTDVLYINEFMAENDTVLEDPDGNGGYPDWIEVYNAGDDEIDLQGLYITDDLTEPTKFEITESLIVPADGYVLLYADNAADQGVNHLGFKLGSSGEGIAIYDADGEALIDSYTFGEQISDISEGRCPDAGGDWTFFTSPTPGSVNGTCDEGSDADDLPDETPEETPDATSELTNVLYINEFMADNDTVLEDPDGNGGYPDWIEIYNAGDEAIDLQGLYITDDLDDPTKFQITESLTVPAAGYLLLYADNDADQGANHLGIKLGISGEDIAIYETDGATLIDYYTFGEQTSDISEGRCPDGESDWTFFTNPTPGTANSSCDD